MSPEQDHAIEVTWVNSFSNRFQKLDYKDETLVVTTTSRYTYTSNRPVQSHTETFRRASPRNAAQE